MLAVLSPAKTLDLTPYTPSPEAPPTEPPFLTDAARLVHALRALDARELAQLMHISPQLAELNFDRFQAWQPTHHLGINDAKPAALAYAGDVYQGLMAPTLTPADLAWSQEHIAIISGLYGLLRPLDLIQPYRLEMGVPLATAGAKHLYAFWGDRLAALAHERLANHADPTLINLASAEYAKALPKRAIRHPVLDVAFAELKGEKATIIGFFAKQARGLMARFIIEERLERAADLRAFAAADYRFDAARSTATRWLFTRPYRTLAAARGTPPRPEHAAGQPTK